MSIRVRPSHVAVLVPSVRKAGEFLQRFGFQIGQEEVWDSEGTKEIYVERPIFVDRIEIPLDFQFQRLIDPIELSGILMPSKELFFSLEGRPIEMEDLL